MEVLNKYGLRIEDKRAIEEYTTSRIAGLLTLYMAKDQRRIKDIINRYYREDNYKRVMPEIEGYIDTNKN